MRTTGSDKELWMTAVPLGFLIFFVIFATGGPKPFLKLVEGMLQTPIEWVSNLLR
jgi:hypothetical protein